MKRWMILSAMGAVLLAGCGGGGGGGGGTNPGGTATLTGRVLQVENGLPASPAASVTTPRGKFNTNSDGDFTALTPSGSTQITVDTNRAAGERNFVFTFPPVATGSTTDLGDLWIGARKVTVRGRVIDAVSRAPVFGADVRFAGQRGRTNAAGQFTLTNVAYPNGSLATFWLIFGSANAANYFPSNFSALDKVAVANVVDVGVIPLLSSNDPNPPGGPFNITGRVLPAGQAPGTVVTLRQGSTPVRTFTIAPGDDRYFFWVPAGTYTVTFAKGALSAPARPANLTRSNTVLVVPDALLQ